MTDKERIERLERLVAKMADALLRWGMERDGNWGEPSFHSEIGEIARDLDASAEGR
jgi:hypothetical protein